jgi:hypothetical protein
LLTGIGLALATLAALLGDRVLSTASVILATVITFLLIRPLPDSRAKHRPIGDPSLQFQEDLTLVPPDTRLWPFVEISDRIVAVFLVALSFANRGELPLELRLRKSAMLGLLLHTALGMRRTE